jgi:hypothetical protein
MRSFGVPLGVGGLALVALGCGAPGEKLVPVAGKVTLDGRPWAVGDVGFFLDPARGNPDRRAAVGTLSADGTYRLFTAGKPGVPPGWYKAVVWATDDPAAAGNPWGPDGKLRPVRWLIDPKYTRADTTPLAVEVVENPPPGHYDLRLTK